MTAARVKRKSNFACLRNDHLDHQWHPLVSDPSATLLHVWPLAILWRMKQKTERTGGNLGMELLRPPLAQNVVLARSLFPKYGQVPEGSQIAGANLEESAKSVAGLAAPGALHGWSRLLRLWPLPLLLFFTSGQSLFLVDIFFLHYIFILVVYSSRSLPRVSARLGEQYCISMPLRECLP